MTHPTLAEVLMAFAICFAAVFSDGCGASSDPLRAAIALNNGAATALNEARAQHEAHVLADYHQRASVCPPAHGAERDTCLAGATAGALAAGAPERTKIDSLVQAQHLAAELLEEARQCRTDDLGCEADKLSQGQAIVAELRAGLARLEGTP